MFRKFLDHVEANVPPDLEIHIAMDNYSTHKTRAVRDWFARRPRWHVHFTPTSASWLNQVERFFADLMDKQIRRGVHRSTVELERTITEYIETVNQAPQAVPMAQIRRRTEMASLPDALTLACYKHPNCYPDVYGRMSWDNVAPTTGPGRNARYRRLDKPV